MKLEHNEEMLELEPALKGLCVNLITVKKFDEAVDSIFVFIRFTFNIMESNLLSMSEAEQLEYVKNLDKLAQWRLFIK